MWHCDWSGVWQWDEINYSIDAYTRYGWMQVYEQYLDWIAQSLTNEPLR